MAQSAWKLYHTNRKAQLGASALTILFAICILATAADTLRSFNSQKHSNPWFMPLWPSHFLTNGVRSLIGASASVAILQAMYLLFSTLPKFNMVSHPATSAVNTACVTFLTSIVSLMSMIFAHVLNHQDDYETIQTWTCKYSDNQYKNPIAGAPVPSYISNGDFNRLCGESKFAIWGMLVVFLLQVFMFISAFVGFVMEKLAARKIRKSGANSPDTNVELVGTGFNDKQGVVVTGGAY